MKLLYINFFLLYGLTLCGSSNDSLVDCLNDTYDTDESSNPRNNTPINFKTIQQFRNKIRKCLAKSASAAQLTKLLIDAIGYNDLEEEVFELLIDEGANIDVLIGKVSDPGKHTLVDRAVILGNHAALLALLKYGAKVNMATGFLSQVPLHRAVIKGDPIAVRALLENRASVIVMDKNFKTPRDLAYFNQEIHDIFTRVRR